MAEQLATIDTTGTQALRVSETDFDGLYSRYLEFMGHRSQRTLDTYRKAIKQFRQFCLSRGISAPTSLDVVNYRNYLSQEKKSVSTVRLYLTSVRTFFKFLSSEGIYQAIGENVESPEFTTTYHKKGFLSLEQEAHLLELASDSPRDTALLSLMLTTGLRTVEVCEALVSDIKSVGGETVLYIRGKGRKEKSDFVKLDTKVESLIRDYVGSRCGDSPIFLSGSNRNTTEALTTRSVSRIVKNYLRRAGLDSRDLTAHSLRHTVATQNILNGGTLEETRQLLRHRDIRTTEIYSHDLQRVANKSEQRLASVLFGKIQENKDKKLEENSTN